MSQFPTLVAAHQAEVRGPLAHRLRTTALKEGKKYMITLKGVNVNY